MKGFQAKEVEVKGNTTTHPVEFTDRVTFLQRFLGYNIFGRYFFDKN